MKYIKKNHKLSDLNFGAMLLIDTKVFNCEITPVEFLEEIKRTRIVLSNENECSPVTRIEYLNHTTRPQRLRAWWHEMERRRRAYPIIEPKLKRILE